LVDPIIIPSAHRHGVSDEQILHVYRNAFRVFDQGDEMTMLIGSDESGQLHEVGVLDSADGPVIAHAMKARDKYLR
jgi:hypothetical protein